MQRPIIQKGTILISRPTLHSDVFQRSVILIVENTGNGFIGFVLNKPINIEVGDFLSKVDSSQIVYEGGPVSQENLFYVHKRPDLIADSQHIIGDLYWSGNFEDVIYSINNGYITNSEIRFYIGYSGWGKNQLECEIESKAWNVVNHINFDLFKTWGVNLWQKQMQDLGGENLLWFNMPENPALN